MRALPRWLLVPAAMAASLLATASPVAADPARPGTTRSEVTDLQPPTEAVGVDIVGGDAFVRLRVQPGHEVVVLGYGGEPYLRIRPDGTVEQNQDSPAVVLNRDRYGNVGLPPVDVSPGAAPRWQAVGSGSTVLWHDHRVHWMARTDPPTIGPDGLVQTWQIHLVVDGDPVVVNGALYRVEGPTPWWWLMVLPVGGAVALAMWRLWDPMRVAAATSAVTAVALLATWVPARLSLPAAARGAPVVEILAVLALATATGAWWWRRPPVPMVLVAGSGAALLAAAWAERAALTAGVVPGVDPAWPLRAVVVLATGVGWAVLASGSWMVLRLPPPGSAADEHRAGLGPPSE